MCVVGLLGWAELAAAQPAVRRTHRRPILLHAEGLGPMLPLPALRSRIEDMLGVELLDISDPRAQRAEGTLSIGSTAEHVVLRVSLPPDRDLWRRLSAQRLGPDPLREVSRAVAEMLSRDVIERLDAGEVRNPFCPEGMICTDVRRRGGWPPGPEAEVLDPWESEYPRRRGAWVWPGRPSRPSASLARPVPRPALSAPASTPIAVAAAPRSAPVRPHRFRLDLLAGAGVHRGGSFFRYEAAFQRRFGNYGLGLSYVGARGPVRIERDVPSQPARRVAHVRRASTLQLSRAYRAESFELEVGGGLGVFFVKLEEEPVVEVRPYARGLITFVLRAGALFEVVLRSELATTFTDPVPQAAAGSGAGAWEYALALGLRHRM